MKKTLKQILSVFLLVILALVFVGCKKTENVKIGILQPVEHDALGLAKKGFIDALAEKGYKEINTRALKLLPRGGWFATCSCSHFMPHERFESMLRSAALDAGVSLMQVEARQQSPDHPILWNVPETDYLKFYLFRVI